MYWLWYSDEGLFLLLWWPGAGLMPFCNLGAVSPTSCSCSPICFHSHSAALLCRDSCAGSLVWAGSCRPCSCFEPGLVLAWPAPAQADPSLGQQLEPRARVGPWRKAHLGPGSVWAQGPWAHLGPGYMQGQGQFERWSCLGPGPGLIFVVLGGLLRGS